jgi:hypothetical protein
VQVQTESVYKGMPTTFLFMHQLDHIFNTLPSKSSTSTMFSKYTIILTAVALPQFALSNPTPPQPNASYPGFIHPKNGVCTDYTVKETVSYPEIQWVHPHFTDNHDLVAFSANVSRKGGLGADQPFGNTKNVTKTFEIASTFCKPAGKKNGHETTVLVATHGLGFDRR